MVERELFLKAVEFTDPAERAAFLDRECAGNRDLRQSVEALLAADARAGQFLDLPHPAAGVPGGEQTGSYQPSPNDPTPLPLGTVVAGRYKLLQLIGEGGMGCVFMADQAEPVKRRVALKLIRSGMDSANVLARFEAERQALALMNHPHIAKVLDAGTTDAGKPFFVMELVKGVPITRYCDEHKLPILERLNLFTQVCAAVQHAHQKGIIHRDLKPSNILIESHDGKPVPKVIDFGLAKATSGMPLTEHTLFTALGMVAGTPQYMAPEQAASNAIDIDTRADIYALGVILYELLTGTTPIQRETLKKAAFDEILRVVREQEPPTPSSRLSSSETKASVAAVRQMEPAKLGRFIRGDLDWIVMKSLSKERDRRYETANGFARDVERFLNHEPVVAGPPSATYKLRKFLRRNKGPVIAASLVLVALVAGMIGTSWGMWRANQSAVAERASAEAERMAKLDADDKRAVAENQQKRAEAGEKLAEDRLKLVEAEKRKVEDEKQIAQAVRDFLQNKLLGQADTRTQADAFLRRGQSSELAKLNPTIRELLDRAALELAVNKIDSNFPNQPLLQAELLETVGITYVGVGEYQPAIALLSRAADLRKTHLGPDHRDTLVTLNCLALANERAGKLPDAIALFETVRTALASKLGPDQPDTLLARHNLAGAYRAAGRLPEAIELLEEVRTAQETQLGPHHSDTLVTLNGLALAYLDAGRLQEAIALFEAVRPAKEAKLGPDHPNTLTTLNNLALAYRDASRLPEAIALFEKVRAVQESKLGHDHPTTLTTLDNLAGAYRAAGRLQEAIILFKKVRTGKEVKLGPDHPDTLITLANLALAHREVGELSQAIALYEQVRMSGETKLPPDHPQMLATLHNLAGVYYAAGRMPEAIALHEKVRTAREVKLGPDHPDTLLTLNNLAGAYGAAGKLPEAIALLERVRTAQEDKLGHDHPHTLTTLNNLAGAYRGAGRLPEAIGLQEKVCAAFGAKLGLDHPNTLHARHNLAGTYHVAGRLQEAIALFDTVRTAQENKLGSDHPNTLNTFNNFARAYQDAGKLELALPLFEQASLGMEKRRFQHEFAAGIISNTIRAYETDKQFENAESWRRKWLAHIKAKSGADSPPYAAELAGLGGNLAQQNKFAEAEAVLRECLAIREKTQPDLWTTFNTISVLGGALLSQKKYADAESLLLKGYEGMKQREVKIPKSGGAELRIPEALDRLIELCTATGKEDEAKKWQAERAKYSATKPAEKK